ncbi:MAG: ADP-heptose--LPS heptosyltransferase, partial [Alistipes sp.]|nr:ADP-heptose--LPS heptosyltransferase [Alistipes sp.]
MVMRTTAMGDVAMLPHALRALCAAYPDLHITVATQPFLRPFFRGLNVDFLDVKTKDEHHSVVG